MISRQLMLPVLWLALLGLWAPVSGQQAAPSPPSSSVSVQEAVPDLASMQARMRAVSPKTVVVLRKLSTPIGVARRSGTTNVFVISPCGL